MSKEELIKAIREIYTLWQKNKLLEDTTEDIDFILDKIIQKIGK